MSQARITDFYNQKKRNRINDLLEKSHQVKRSKIETLLSEKIRASRSKTRKVKNVPLKLQEVPSSQQDVNLQAQLDEVLSSAVSKSSRAAAVLAASLSPTKKQSSVSSAAVETLKAVALSTPEKKQKVSEFSTSSSSNSTTFDSKNIMVNRIKKALNDKSSFDPKPPLLSQSEERKKRLLNLLSNHSIKSPTKTQPTPLTPSPKSHLSPKKPESQPAYQKYSHLSAPSSTLLPLPPHYSTLLDLFISLDLVLSILMNRNELTTYTKVKTAVQKMNKVNLSLERLGQIKTIYPNGYNFMYEKNLPCFGEGRSSKYQLTIEANIQEDPKRENSPMKTPQRFTGSILLKRKDLFHLNLLSIVKSHHLEFLKKKKINLKSPDSILRWHPSFPLEKVLQIEPTPLPEPPDQEVNITTASDAFAHCMKNERIKRALEFVTEMKNNQIPSTFSNSATSSSLPTTNSSTSSPSSTPSATYSTSINSSTSCSVSIENSKNQYKGIPPSLLNKIRLKEAMKAEKQMVMPEEEINKRMIIERIPNLCKIIRNFFMTQRRPALPYMEVVACLSNSYKASLSHHEANEHLKVMCDLLPDWLKIVKVTKGQFIKIDIAMEMTKIHEKIEKLVKS